MIQDNSSTSSIQPSQQNYLNHVPQSGDDKKYITYELNRELSNKSKLVYIVSVKINDNEKNYKITIKNKGTQQEIQKLLNDHLGKAITVAEKRFSESDNLSSFKYKLSETHTYETILKDSNEEAAEESSSVPSRINTLRNAYFGKISNNLVSSSEQEKDETLLDNRNKSFKAEITDTDVEDSAFEDVLSSDETDKNKSSISNLKAWLAKKFTKSDRKDTLEDKTTSIFARFLALFQSSSKTEIEINPLSNEDTIISEKEEYTIAQDKNKKETSSYKLFNRFSSFITSSKKREELDSESIDRPFTNQQRYASYDSNETTGNKISNLLKKLPVISKYYQSKGAAEQNITRLYDE